MTYPYRKLIKPRLGTPIIKSHRLGPAGGLVGCWLFNENGNTTVLDLSGNEKSLALTNCIWQSSPIGQAVYFNGSSSSATTSSRFAAIAPASAYSVSCWIRPDVHSANIFLWSQVGGSSDRAAACWVSGQAYLSFEHWDGASYNSVKTGDLTVGNLYHLLFVNYPDKSKIIYVNGVANTAAGSALSPGSAAANFIWGKHPTSATYYYTGLLAMGSVYNRVLSANEAIQLYREPFYMFKDPNEWAILGGYTVPVVGMAGAMTTNTGYWGW